MRRVPFTTGETTRNDVGRWCRRHQRHAGHMDIVRELIDGATGDHPEDEPSE